MNLPSDVSTIALHRFARGIALAVLAVALATPAVAQVPVPGAGANAPQPAPPYPVNAPGSPRAAAPATGVPGGPGPIGANTPGAFPLLPGEAGPVDYKIGPSDLIEIQVFGIDNLKREVRVNSRGHVSLPLIGPVPVGGLTSQEAEDLIATKYKKDFLQDPQVSVFIKEFTSQRITVEGAVSRPGIYPIRGDTTLLQAIALAGGQGQLPDLTEVMVFRLEEGKRKTLTYDFIKIRGGELEDPKIMSEDIVVVKRSQERVVLRDSIIGDIINIVNPFNYLPKF